MGTKGRANFFRFWNVNFAGEYVKVVMGTEVSFKDSEHSNMVDSSIATVADIYNEAVGLTTFPPFTESTVIIGLLSLYDSTFIELVAYLVPYEAVTVIVEPVFAVSDVAFTVIL